MAPLVTFHMMHEGREISENSEGLPADQLDEDLWRIMLETLRASRVTRRIPMRVLAKEMGVHFSHLSRMEKCKTTPSVTLAFRWCRHLGIDFDSLYRAAVISKPEDTEIG
jgi:DNA-binding XRE family transcriptional regulator